MGVFMEPRLSLLMDLLTTLPQLSTLPPLTTPLLTLMSHPPTLTPTLLLMTTPTPTSMLPKLVMVPEMLRDLIPLLFLMAVPSMLPTRLMAVLLMLPMKELLSTQMPLHLTRLPLSLPMLVKKDKKKLTNNNTRHTELTETFKTNTQDRDTVFRLFIHIYLL